MNNNSPHWSYFQSQLSNNDRISIDTGNSGLNSSGRDFGLGMQSNSSSLFGQHGNSNSVFPTPIGRPLTSGGAGGIGGASSSTSSASSGLFPISGTFGASTPSGNQSPSFLSRPIRRMSPITTWNGTGSTSGAGGGLGGGGGVGTNISGNSHSILSNHVSNGGMNNSSSHMNNDSGSGAGGGGNSSALREAGIVEKLLPSYGFIQCCERQARLFFHYSQFNGNIEHLKLGDPVEFEMTYDRRTGKPIASSVQKISNEVFPSDADVTNPDQPGQSVNGFITTEPMGGKDGRVAYENRGECFFLPFTLDDVEPGLAFRSNDKVSFRIATDKSGNLRARKLTLVTSTPERYQGIVCTLKDSFGFIERADIVKEIFFHSSECQDFKSLNLGDDVEFGIQTRNDKKVAVDVRPLEPGSVVFEKVSEDRVNGVVMKMATRAHNSWGRQQYSSASSAGPMIPGSGVESGVIRVMSERLNEDICFAIKDINGDFTLKEGDIVTLNVVTDKRDNMKHAGKIELHPECFKRNNEQRDNGYVASLKDNYGFIKCFNREGTRVYFKISELLNPNLAININDEVEFTLSPDVSSPGRFQAIRIAILPNGSIMKSLLSQPGSSSSGMRNNGMTSGSQRADSLLDYPLIDLDADDSTSNNSQQMQSQQQQQSNYGRNNSDSRFSGSAVRSDTWTEILSQIPIDINSGYSNSTTDLLTSSSSAPPDAPDNHNSGSFVDHLASQLASLSASVTARQPLMQSTPATTRGSGRGFIAAVKDSYGFIETEDHQNEIFFHFSVFEGNSGDMEVGHDVEFSFIVKNGKANADYCKLLPRRSIPREDLISGEVLSGTVIRTCRCLNPDQDSYPGIVRIVPVAADGEADVQQQPLPQVQEAAGGEEVEFSMTSLVDVREFIQWGDSVCLQIGVCPLTGRRRAVNMTINRSKKQATIDTIKNNYGFINYDAASDGKKLFFHMSEFKGENPNDLKPGDSVEFAVVHNQRTNKFSACSLTRCAAANRMPRQRPEHLISRLKLTSAADGMSSKIIAIRQPKGPDGTRGFAPRVVAVGASVMAPVAAAAVPVVSG